MNKGYISEAFDQLNQMNKRKSILKEELSTQIEGKLYTLSSVRDYMENKLSSDLNELKNAGNLSDEDWSLQKSELLAKRGWPSISRELYEVRLQAIIKKYKKAAENLLKMAERKYGREFSSLEQIPVPEKKKEFSGTINSFKQLKKLHTDNVRSFTLGSSLLYDYVDSIEDNWSELIDGVEDEDDALSLFRIRGNNAYLPKGTTLDYAGHDNYYDWFRVNGTDKKIGFISDYAMY